MIDLVLGHDWSESPGDVPCIGYIPSCLACGISSSDFEAANAPCPMGRALEPEPFHNPAGESVVELRAANDNLFKIAHRYRILNRNYCKAVEAFLGATGHDLCHENRRVLASAFGLVAKLPKAPETVEEFHQGCLEYQRQIYGKTGEDQ